MILTYCNNHHFAQFCYKDTRSALLWLALRVNLGWTWLSAGWHKLQNPAWVGDQAGAAVTGFLNGALAKTMGEHPDVQSWYATFINHVALPHAELFSYLVTFGEMLVGIALIVGLLVGASAFFAALMNMSFLLAGTVSINPTMLITAIFLILAWRVAGWYGLDRWVLPKLLKSEALVQQKTG